MVGKKLVIECEECGKTLTDIHVCVCVNKERLTEKDEIEVLDSEWLFTFCEDCFKKVRIIKRTE